MLTQKTILPLAIALVTVLAWQAITKNPPENRRSGPASSAQMIVEVKKIERQSYEVILDSFGTVKPRTESVLVAQVSGQINYVSAQFRDGGFFERGDVLIKIDDRDYQAEVKVAQSTLITAKQTQLEEQARAKQALADWQRLGNGNKPGPLVLRQPQLESAKAKVLSAQAQLEKAQLKLERTALVAPYAGRVLKQRVDVGQVVSLNSQLADIYAVDFVEIRLPIKNNDLALINLPEEYRRSNPNQEVVPVHFISDLMGLQQWRGEVVRTEGAIDNNAQQLYIVAQISDPYRSQDNRPIKIGQYVTAKIKGKVIDDAMVIPNSAIYQGSYVYVVKEGVLLRKNIQTRWQNDLDAIVSSGLDFGDELVLTSLGQVSSGTPVNVMGLPNNRRALAEQRGNKNGLEPLKQMKGKSPGNKPPAKGNQL